MSESGWRSFLPRYKTVRRASIADWRLSLLYLSIVSAIVLYVLIYTIILQRGYQVAAPMSGNSAVKVQGAAINIGGTPWSNATFPDGMFQYYDATDLVTPAFEHQALTIITNLWETHGQTRDRCYPGSPEWWNRAFPNATAESDCASSCIRGTIQTFTETTSQGVWTGDFKLVNASDLYPNSAALAGKQLCYCELNTWCPDEFLDPAPANPFHLTGIDGFEVSVRTNAQFHQFGTRVSTTVQGIWSVAEILAMGGYSYEQIRQKGVDLLMSYEWNCNVNMLADCVPKLTVNTLIPTFSFHTAEFTNGVSGPSAVRNLNKKFAIRLVVENFGSGYRFDAATLFTNIGAGFGLLTLASLIADFVALWLLQERQAYRDAKYKRVNLRHGGATAGIAASDSEAAGSHLHPSPLNPPSSKLTSLELLPGAGTVDSDDSRAASQL